MVESLDREASRFGVTRQSNVWIAERLEQKRQLAASPRRLTADKRVERTV
jgi:hypothetical protein